MKCAVINCGKSDNNKYQNAVFFRFPADTNLTKNSIKLCRQDKVLNPTTCYLCMDLFTSEEFEKSHKYHIGFTKKRILNRYIKCVCLQRKIQNPKRQRKQGAFI